MTEQEINQLATDITLKALGLDPVQQQQANADWLLGQFDVKAKSPAGLALPGAVPPLQPDPGVCGE